LRTKSIIYPNSATKIGRIKIKHNSLIVSNSFPNYPIDALGSSYWKGFEEGADFCGEGAGDEGI